MPNLRGYEILIIVLLIVLLFGAKRLPDAARSIGRSMRIFKAETKGLVEEESSTPPAAAPRAVEPGTERAAPQPGTTEPAAQPQPPSQ